MKKIAKSIISLILVVCISMLSVVPTYAVDGEEYLCELRLIYAEDYDEACDILDGSEFYEYELYEENLNSGTGEIGVFLAYKTTENIEEAITDIAVMQMDGGYNEGNYQEMIKQSYQEYITMGESYVRAIKYFKKAYEAGDFMANAVYRQLNFYIVTDEEMGYDEDLLGDILTSSITADELATMFMEGNRYAMNNVRTLISMGVSYNEDGKHYLEKVSDAAAEMTKNPSVFDYGNKYNAYAYAIAPTIAAIRTMFKDLIANGQDLNYYDDDLTDKEIKYAEAQSIADRFKEINYLNGETLYDFCYDYTIDEDNMEELYPLVHALNDGQKAMTEVAHYYDVVRYSMSDYPEDMLTDKIDDLEETYSICPFDIYTGVDRSIYDGTFALTSEAYREDAYTEEGLMAHMFNNENLASTIINTTLLSVGTGLYVWSICRTAAAIKAGVRHSAEMSYLAYELPAQSIQAGSLANTTLLQALGADTCKSLHLNADWTVTQYVNDLFNSMFQTSSINDFSTQMLMIRNTYSIDGIGGAGYRDIHQHLTHSRLSKPHQDAFHQIYQDQYLPNIKQATNESYSHYQPQIQESTSQFIASTAVSGIFTGIIFVVGGLMMVYSAVNLYETVYNYYHPDYDDIPLDMVDLVETRDGDRYIKYDVVLEAEAQYGGEYAAGDLNAFEGARWNALYYTKSYEAGQPLLADFEISYSNNEPDEGASPVHRFGEVVCYDLNKYNFDHDSDNIYLSVYQSEYQKSSVADVPEVVGSIFSAGWVFLAGGVGALAGVGCTLGTQVLIKGKKKSAAGSADTSIDTDQSE